MSGIRALHVLTSSETGGASTPADQVHLDYEGRLLRRKRLVAEGGLSFLVDLPQTTSLRQGDRFVLDDGRQVEVHAAPENLMRVRGNLARLAWHIGNRHKPCQIAEDHLLIQEDHVLRAMLDQLGAEVETTVSAFEPEGGAYGHGRTFEHTHGPDGHTH